MQEEWQKAMRDFDAVWQRVHGGAEASGDTPGDGTAALERMIRAEASGEAYYRAIARLTEGRAADLLLRLSADCGGNLKRLQTEYFLETGDTRVPERETIPYDGFPGYLRRAYLREKETERAYLDAAACANTEARRLLFGDLAQRCGNRGAQLRELIGRVLG